MSSTKVLALIGAVFLSLLPFSASADEGWELAKDSDGIRVWTRYVPGHPIREFRAVTVVRSSLSGLVNLILDTDHAARWIYRTMSVQVVKRDDEKQTFVVRVETDFPWPLANRDVVVAGRITQGAGAGAVTIRSQAVPDGVYPRDPAFVRMPDFVGDWIFRPLGGGMVEVTMQGRADPGGLIPAAVVNLIIYETPYLTLRGLRDVIGDARYQEHLLPQIREPQP
jgi:hypothetical protein